MAVGARSRRGAGAGVTGRRYDVGGTVGTHMANLTKTCWAGLPGQRFTTHLVARVLAVVVAMVVASPLVAPTLTIQAAAPIGVPADQDCLVAGPVDRFGPQIEDFGGGGEPYIRRVDYEYWSSRGYMVGFDRKIGESYAASRRGGYMFTGIVLAPDASTASDDLKSAMTGWTSEWDNPQQRPVDDLGDEALVAERPTSWEVAPGEPMTEVLLGFRRCNVSAVVLLAAMPKYGPVEQAARYARIIIGKVA